MSGQNDKSTLKENVNNIICNQINGIMIAAGIWMSGIAAGGLVFASDALTGGNIGLEDEIAWLQAEAVTTRIATKTEMDADLVPGMVTVLTGEDLEEQGIRTVFEALSLVPGVDVFRDGGGDAVVIIRGIGNLNENKVKLLFNGVAVNPALWGELNCVYDIPAEQVPVLKSSGDRAPRFTGNGPVPA